MNIMIIKWLFFLLFLFAEDFNAYQLSNAYYTATVEFEKDNNQYTGANVTINYVNQTSYVYTVPSIFSNAKYWFEVQNKLIKKNQEEVINIAEINDFFQVEVNLYDNSIINSITIVEIVVYRKGSEEPLERKVVQIGVKPESSSALYEVFKVFGNYIENSLLYDASNFTGLRELINKMKVVVFFTFIILIIAFESIRFLFDRNDFNGYASLFIYNLFIIGVFFGLPGGNNFVPILDIVVPLLKYILVGANTIFNSIFVISDKIDNVYSLKLFDTFELEQTQLTFTNLATFCLVDNPLFFLINLDYLFNQIVYLSSLISILYVSPFVITMSFLPIYKDIMKNVVDKFFRSLMAIFIHSAIYVIFIGLTMSIWKNMGYDIAQSGKAVFTVYQVFEYDFLTHYKYMFIVASAYFSLPTSFYIDLSSPNAFLNTIKNSVIEGDLWEWALSAILALLVFIITIFVYIVSLLVFVIFMFIKLIVILLSTLATTFGLLIFVNFLYFTQTRKIITKLTSFEYQSISDGVFTYTKQLASDVSETISKKMK